jgi:predicted phosphate transport protein (TIGR00153 family)
MNILAKLLGGPSPFGELQKHLEKVMECVEYVEPILSAALDGNADKVKELAETVFKIEHDADLIKLSIRDNLPRDLLLPVSRVDFLQFLREQDSLADKVEDLAMMLTVRKLKLPEDCVKRSCRDELLGLAKHSVAAAKVVAEMTRKLEEVKEAGFRGPVTEELRAAAKEVGEMEHAADKHQFRLLRALMAQNDDQAFADTYATMSVISSLGKLANHAESMSDYLRLMIAE